MPEIITTILSGMLIGLIMPFLPGPVFFSLIDTSIKKGMHAGFILAFGIFLSDAIYVCFTNLFFDQIEGWNLLPVLLGFAGAIVLTILGIQNLRKKPERPHKALPSSGIAKFGLFAKGFAINFAHPGVLIGWMGIVGTARAQMGMGQGSPNYWPFAIAIVVTSFSIDLIKAFLASKIDHWLTPRRLLYMTRTFGYIMLSFAVYLLIDGISAAITGEQILDLIKR